MTGPRVGSRIAWRLPAIPAQSSAFAPAAFYEEWFPRVYAYFARRTADAAAAEDLTADTFERVVAALADFTPNENPAATRIWVYRIAANVYKNSLRHATRQQARDLAWAAAWRPESGADADQSIAVGQAVGALDYDDQNVLGLRYWDGLTAPEIAAVLGLRQREVYTILERCLRELRKRLEPPTDDRRQGES
jgi:RNA polymerase sigma factor (sigma-70 family)